MCVCVSVVTQKFIGITWTPSHHFNLVQCFFSRFFFSLFKKPIKTKFMCGGGGGSGNVGLLCMYHSPKNICKVHVWYDDNVERR